MTEITVENIEGDIVTEEEAPQTLSERLIERGDGDFVEPAPEAPAPEQVAFQTSQGEVSFAVAPKRRGRPKGKAKPKEPKRPREPVQDSVAAPEALAPPQQPIDVNALLAPI